MRAINTQDVFRLSRIIKAINIKEEIPKITRQIEQMNEVKQSIQEDDAEEVKKEKQRRYEEIMLDLGVNIVFSIIEKYSDPRSERAVYELLGGILEKKPDEIANQPIQDTINDIKRIAAENNLINLFKQAGQLT